MSRLSKIVLVLFFALAASAMNRPLLAIQFFDSVSVNDTAIRLGDIAHCDSTRYAPDMKDMLNTIVGEAAPAGFSRRVGSDEVLDCILKHKFPAVEFRPQPKKSIVVATASIEKTVGEYENLIRKYCADKIRWAPGDFSVALRNSNEKFRCLDKPLSVDVSGLTSSYPKGIVNLLLTAKQGTKKYAVPVVCNVSVVTNVLVSARQIEHGSQLDSSNCAVQKMDITRFGHESIPSASELKNMVATRTISKGAIIYAQMVARRPIVAKDDQVFVVVERGRIKVSIAMRARENGAMGDKIWVENEVSHKLIKTLVVGKNEVTVLDGGKDI
jgi:flagella basal body P-ring formation protein FlgA